MSVLKLPGPGAGIAEQSFLLHRQAHQAINLLPIPPDPLPPLPPGREVGGRAPCSVSVRLQSGLAWAAARPLPSARGGGAEGPMTYAL